MTIDAPCGDDIPALRQLWQQAFGDTAEFLDGFFRTGFSFDRCRCLKTDGRLAAALYWFDCTWQEKKLAYLYAVATDKAFQGKGLCRALMEDTHRHLQSLGCAGAALVPGNAGLFALYKKLGYRAFCPMQTVCVEAGEQAEAVRSVDADAFRFARRQRLPAGSILQEGETLEYLRTFSGFYAGQDSLMCLSQEESTLYFQEYLGDPHQLPGIIRGFGAETGIVRLPGGNTPTAMYRSLDDSDALPAYLGIALN